MTPDRKITLTIATAIRTDITFHDLIKNSVRLDQVNSLWNPIPGLAHKPEDPRQVHAGHEFQRITLGRTAIRQPTLADHQQGIVCRWPSAPRMIDERSFLLKRVSRPDLKYAIKRSN